MPKSKLIISIQAHCSDSFTLIGTLDGNQIHEYSGYVPGDIGCLGSGDDVCMDIDAETGQILNWKPVTLDQLTEIGTGDS